MGHDFAMDAAKLVLEYVQALVWPSFILLLMIFFRSEFRGLLHRLRSARGGGLEAEFGEEFQQVEAQSREAAEGEAALLASRPSEEIAIVDLSAEKSTPRADPHIHLMVEPQSALTPSRDIAHSLGAIARTHPAGAILAGWREVEMKLNEVFRLHYRELEHESANQRRHLGDPIRQIEFLKHQGLGVRAAESMRSLKNLRNHVAHGVVPSGVDAKDYLDACDNAVWMLSLFSALHGDPEKGSTD